MNPFDRTGAFEAPRLAAVLACVVSLIPACAMDETDFPLGGTQSGLIALSWGDSGDSPIRHMLSMDSLQLIEDTTTIFAEPMHRTPDTVEISAVPVEKTRLVRFEGGFFLGHPVDEWHLRFDEKGRLHDVTIVSIVTGNPLALFREIRMHMNRLFGPPHASDERFSAYHASGWKRVERGMPTTNVRFWQWRNRRSGKTSRFVFEFTDKARDDSVQALHASVPRRPMHVDEWKKLRKTLIDNLERDS